MYRTDDGRFVVKLKHDLGGTREHALAHAKSMRAAAEQYIECLGGRHTIPSYYLLARDSAGQVQTVVVQPFLQGGRALFAVDYAALSEDERHAVAVSVAGGTSRSGASSPTASTTARCVSSRSP